MLRNADERGKISENPRSQHAIRGIRVPLIIHLCVKNLWHGRLASPSSLGLGSSVYVLVLQVRLSGDRSSPVIT